MRRLRRASLLVTSVLVVAACRTEPSLEQVAASSQALSPTNLVGTSLPSKTLALSFDDGPGDHTAEMSTYLASQGIKASFFFVGGHIAPTSLPNPNGVTVTPGAAALLAQVVADGHLVGNHTTTHRDLVAQVLPTGSAKVVQELAETDADITGYVPSSHFLFRAPYGYYDQNVWNAVKVSAMNKYVGPIRWDIGGESGNYPAQAADWACWQNALQTSSGGATFGATTKECGDAYLTEITAVGRGIVLMHDSSSSANGSTLAMVEYIVPILKARGYSFVRPDEVPDIAALLGPAPCDPSCATCTAAGTCASCRNGTYLSAGACQACRVCGGGTYVAAACTTVANTVCASCDASCITCSAGGATHCTSCSGGSWLSAGSCRPCRVCSAGAYQTAACTAMADTGCAACSAGTFSASPGSASCDRCEPGTFAGQPGSTTCTACAPGEYAPLFGATACSKCNAGDFSANPGAALCSSCTAGSFAASGASACSQCPAGTSSADGAAACIACAPGSYAGAGAASCTRCEPGSFAPSAGASSCIPCGAGTFADASGASACVACAAGSYSDPGAPSCTSCGGCDDGDACTADSCQAATGCAHVPISGCPADAGAMDSGAADGAATDAGRRDAGEDASTSPPPSTDDASTPPPAGSADVDVVPIDPDGDAPGSSAGGCDVARASPQGPSAALALGLLAVSVLLLLRPRPRER